MLLEGGWATETDHFILLEWFVSLTKWICDRDQVNSHKRHRQFLDWSKESLPVPVCKTASPTQSFCRTSKAPIGEEMNSYNLLESVRPVIFAIIYRYLFVHLFTYLFLSMFLCLIINVSVLHPCIFFQSTLVHYNIPFEFRFIFADIYSYIYTYIYCQRQKSVCVCVRLRLNRYIFMYHIYIYTYF